MSIFDVRGNGVGEITEIVFADASGYEYPYKIVKCGTSCIELVDEDEGIVSVDNKDIPNLILALQKAVELWVPVPKVVLAAKKPVVKKPVAKAK
jgi:hypothetical protein